MDNVRRRRGYAVHGLVRWTGELRTAASTTGSDGDKVSCDERVARLFAPIFRQELPQANKTTFKLPCVRGAAELDSAFANHE